MRSSDQMELHEIQHDIEIMITKEYADFIIGQEIKGKIQVISDYPDGWHSIFACDGWVWMLRCDSGHIGLVEVGELMAIRPNETIVYKGGPRAREQAIECEKFFRENGEPDLLPLVCENFCDRDEMPCRFCAKMRNIPPRTF